MLSGARFRGASRCLVLLGACGLTLCPCVQVVQDLKAERTKLGYGLLRYRKLCKDAYNIKLQQEADPEFDPSADNPELLQAEAQKTKQSEIYKATLGQYEKAHTQTFDMAIPGLLSDMQDREELRVQTFKESITTALIAISERAGSVRFSKTMDGLAGVTPEQVHTCKMSSTPPNPPIFTEPTIEQMYGEDVPTAVAPSVAAVAKDSAAATAAAAEAGTPAVETHPKKDEKNFFSSWFTKKPAPSAKTVATPPPNMYSESSTSAAALAAAAVPSSAVPLSQPPNVHSQSSAAAPKAPPSPARPYEIPKQPETQTWKEEAEAEARAEAARKQSLDDSRRASNDADVSENADQRAAAAAMEAVPTAAWSELDDTPPTTPPKKEEAPAAPVAIPEESVAAPVPAPEVAAPAPAEPSVDEDDEDETF